MAKKQSAEYEEAETDCREQATKTGDAAATASIEHQELAAETKAAREAELELEERHTRLAHHGHLIALAEADQRIDVWGDAEHLRHALTDTAAAAEAAALLIAVEAAEDERMLASVDNSGLLPAPAATLVVVDQLMIAGLIAETAWTTLFRDYTEPDRLRAVTARPTSFQESSSRRRCPTTCAVGARDRPDAGPHPSDLGRPCSRGLWRRPTTLPAVRCTMGYTSLALPRQLPNTSARSKPTAKAAAQPW
jgi:hypothetical protein